MAPAPRIWLALTTAVLTLGQLPAGALAQTPGGDPPAGPSADAPNTPADAPRPVAPVAEAAAPQQGAMAPGSDPEPGGIPNEQDPASPAAQSTSEPQVATPVTQPVPANVVSSQATVIPPAASLPAPRRVNAAPVTRLSVRIVNPNGTGVPITYAVGGRENIIRSGESKFWELNGRSEVLFDRGENFGEARYQFLESGRYEFRYTASGWELYRTSPTTNPTIPVAHNVPVSSQAPALQGTPVSAQNHTPTPNDDAASPTPTVEERYPDRTGTEPMPYPTSPSPTMPASGTSTPTPATDPPPP